MDLPTADDMLRHIANDPDSGWTDDELGSMCITLGEIRLLPVLDLECLWCGEPTAGGLYCPDCDIARHNMDNGR